MYYIQTMTLSIIKLIISCVVIFIGTEILVNSSVALSNKLKIPRVVVGTLIVSLATSLPELFVSLKSVSLGFDEFALGNIIGSNISNIGLVLGIMSLISTLTLMKHEIIWCFTPLLIVSLTFLISFQWKVSAPNGLSPYNLSYYCDPVLSIATSIHSNFA